MPPESVCWGQESTTAHAFSVLILGHINSKHSLLCPRLNECYIGTYHGCRGTAGNQRQQSAAFGDVVREAEKDGSPSPQPYGEQGEVGRVSGRDIQARIQHVRAAIEAAKAADRPDVLRAEVNSNQDHASKWAFTILCMQKYNRHLEYGMLLALLTEEVYQSISCSDVQLGILC